MGRLLYRWLVSLDKFANFLLGGNPDETISRRADRARHQGKWWGLQLCTALEFLDPDHCEWAADHLPRDDG